MFHEIIFNRVYILYEKGYKMHYWLEYHIHCRPTVHYIYIYIYIYIYGEMVDFANSDMMIHSYYHCIDDSFLSFSFFLSIETLHNSQCLWWNGIRLNPFLLFLSFIHFFSPKIIPLLSDQISDETWYICHHLCSTRHPDRHRTFVKYYETQCKLYIYIYIYIYSVCVCVCVKCNVGVVHPLAWRMWSDLSLFVLFVGCLIVWVL